MLQDLDFCHDKFPWLKGDFFFFVCLCEFFFHHPPARQYFHNRVLFRGTQGRAGPVVMTRRREATVAGLTERGKHGHLFTKKWEAATYMYVCDPALSPHLRFWLAEQPEVGGREGRGRWNVKSLARADDFQHSLTRTSNFLFIFYLVFFLFFRFSGPSMTFSHKIMLFCCCKPGK